MVMVKKRKSLTAYYEPIRVVPDDDYEYSYREYNYRELPPDHPDRVHIEKLLATLKPPKKETIIATTYGDKIKQKRRKRRVCDLSQANG